MVTLEYFIGAVLWFVLGTLFGIKLADRWKEEK